MKRFLSILLTTLLLTSVLTVAAFAANTDAVKVSATASATDVKVGESFTVTLSHSAMQVKSFTCGVIFDPSVLEVTAITKESGYSAAAASNAVIDPQLSIVNEANAAGKVGFAVVRTADTSIAAGDILKITFTALQKADATAITPYQDSDGTDNTQGQANGAAVNVAVKPARETGLYDGQYYKNGVLAPNAGIISYDDNLYYIAADAMPKTGVVNVAENKLNDSGLVAGRYYFGEDGKMVTTAGMIQVGDYYYCLSDTGLCRTGIIKLTTSMINGTDVSVGLHFFNTDGKMKASASVLVYDSNIYYLGNGGLIKTNLIIKVAGSKNVADGRYYFDADGKMRTTEGIFVYGGSNYYLSATGAVQTGIIKVAADKVNDSGLSAGVYFFMSDGKMQTKSAIIKYSNNIYYLSTGGAAKTDVVAQVGENSFKPAGRYHFDADGKMNLTPGMVKVGDYYYYLGATGAVQTDMVINVKAEKLNDSGITAGKHYFASNGRMRAKLGIYKVGDNIYFFDENGLIQSGLIKVTSSMLNGVTGVPTGYHYFMSNGVMKTGASVVKDDNGVYYLGANGVAKTNLIVKVADSKNVADGRYYFDAEGKLRTTAGIFTLGGNTYYLSDTGAIQSGAIHVTEEMVNDSGLTPGIYYFMSTGVMKASSTIVQDETGTYYLGKGGLAKTDVVAKVAGSSKLADGYYYFGTDGKLYTTAGLLKVGDNYYCVGSNGMMQTGEVEITAEMLNGYDVTVGTYTFSSSGKMVVDASSEMTEAA